MTAIQILVIFLLLRFAQHLVERFLARINRSYYLDPDRQRLAREVLSISEEDMAKTLAYTTDKFAFGTISGWIQLVVTMAFLGFGGLGYIEQFATSWGLGGIGTGLVFFGALAVLAMLLNIPFAWYHTFRIEEKHGFNRQTIKRFFLDRVKGLLIGAVLGGLLMSTILWIMDVTGTSWWIYAWAAMTFFSILTAWLYPTLLAPLFNKFSPVESGELREKIDALADRIGFETAGIFIMDASTRSSHGNAYFTGVFGKKRIVLFDTLVDAMSPKEVVAVLAHELGHFKLKHVRWGLVRGTAMSALTFYLLSLCLPLEKFYVAFGLDGVSNYGALLVFGLWFGLADFVLNPVENYLSRRNEFAADAFARTHIGNATDLGDALLKLREKSNVMPISHPVYSGVYHSHPPLMERLGALRADPI